MEVFNKIIDELNNLKINYKIIDHPPAITVELADKYIEGVDGVRSKTMFLTNKKKTNYYLIIMDEFKRLDINKFKELVNEKNIKMASSDSLMLKMKLEPGVVSPFGLLFNDEKDIKVFYDKSIINEEIICFHPNTNTKTFFLKTNDIIKFIKHIGFDVNIIDL